MIIDETDVRIPVGAAVLAATVAVPRPARGVVLFAHGTGSSRHSPRNRMVAGQLQAGGYATVLLDLLTTDEEETDLATAELRFDIGLLAGRLAAVIDWVLARPERFPARVGLFGASTGAAAALVAAARRPDAVRAVVSRGGRPDLAGTALRDTTAPTLLLVGGDDYPVIGLNEAAAAVLGPSCQLAIIPGASHLFAEPGALEQVAQQAREWFDRYLDER